MKNSITNSEISGDFTLPRNAKDLTGQRFGRLVVDKPLQKTGRGILWRCHCDCGGTKDVLSALLTAGKTRSCGCIKREEREKQNITGHRFGRLVAIELVRYNERNEDCWLFRCDCGSEKVMSAASVKWNRVRSCGCLYREHVESLRRQDFTGRRFGRLVAVAPMEERDRSGSVVWRCRCDCGTEVFYSVSRLTQGTTLSCGCLYRESRATCSEHRQDTVEGTMLSGLIAAKELRGNNSSGHTGVSFDRRTQKWQAYINFQKKRHHLGFFSTKEEAIIAREEAEKQLHDPLIREQWDKLTERAKEKYLLLQALTVGE